MQVRNQYGADQRYRRTEERHTFDAVMMARCCELVTVVNGPEQNVPDDLWEGDSLLW